MSIYVDLTTKATLRDDWDGPPGGTPIPSKATQTLFPASTVRPNSRAPQPSPRPGNISGPHAFSARGPT